MRLLKAQMSFTRLCWREFVRPTRNLANPQGSHELEARQSVQILRVPFPEGWVLRSLSHDRVLHHRVAKVVNYRGDGEDSAEAFVKAFLCHLSLVRLRFCLCSIFSEGHRPQVHANSVGLRGHGRAVQIL